MVAGLLLRLLVVMVIGGGVFFFFLTRGTGSLTEVSGDGPELSFICFFFWNRSLTVRDRNSMWVFVESTFSFQ